MKKVIKLLSILMLCLSTLVFDKLPFVMAYSPITVKVPVTVRNIEGNVKVSNWQGTMKDSRYSTNGPLPTVSEQVIGAEKTVNFTFEFSEFGNYVYRIEEPASLNTDPNVEYDKRVYRFYITIIDDGTGNKLVPVFEAEDCGINGQACPYNDEEPDYVTPSTEKVSKVEFINKDLFWVKYTNGEEPYYYNGADSSTPDDETNKHGKSSEYNDGKPSETGKPYDSYPIKDNVVTSDSGWEFTGEYDYIITRDKVDSNGNKVLDANGNPVQEIVPDKEWLFNGKYYPSENAAKAAVDEYNRTRSTGEPEKSYSDIQEVNPLKDRTSGETIAPKGTTTDPRSIQVKGNITFIPRFERVYWVHYLDGDHGTSDRAGNEEGKHLHDMHTPPSPNKVTPHSGWEFTGQYSYVIYLDDGTTITGTTSDPTTLEILGNIELTPIYKPVPTPPSGGGGSGKPSSGWWVPYTGDMTHLALYTGIFGGSILLILVLLLYRRK